MRVVKFEAVANAFPIGIKYWIGNSRTYPAGKVGVSLPQNLREDTAICNLQRR